jgi:hypothetical protein
LQFHPTIPEQSATPHFYPTEAGEIWEKLNGTKTSLFPAILHGNFPFVFALLHSRSF